MDYDRLKQELHERQCSLVVQDSTGRVTHYNKKGVRDLDELLNKHPETLRGAYVADKVVGKAAAGLMVVGGVAGLYTDVMSNQALPLLTEAGVECHYAQRVDHIVIADGDDRCPLEKIVGPASSASEVVNLLHAHFAEMQRKRNA